MSKLFHACPTIGRKAVPRAPSVAPARFRIAAAAPFLAVGLGALVAASTAGHAQNLSSSALRQEGPTVRLDTDKSQFNLFNRTPDALMRPFSTDRPGKSHSALTVDAGHIQVEGDFWNYTWDRYTPDRTTRRAYTLAAPNLKLGVTNWAELDVIFPIYNSLAVRSRAGEGNERAFGIGDVLLGGKVNFFGNDDGKHALGAIAFIKLPTAARGLGNNMAEFFLNVPYTMTLPNRFSLTIEPGAALVRNAYKQGYHGNYQLIANLNRPIICDVVVAALEVSFEYGTDRNIGPRHTIDPSLQWLITPNVQLDVGIYIGVSKTAPDYNPYVGISFRY